MSVAVGVELNQERAAVCVIEGDHREDGVHFLVRHLERLPPKLRYPLVADRLGEIFRRLRRHEKSFLVYVNESSVGQPVVDLVDKACRDTSFQRVHFNHGQEAPENAGYILNLGKWWLVSHLQVLLQTGRLHLLDESPEHRQLSEELLSFQRPPEPGGRDIPGSFRVGTRDELVNTLGMAVHCDPPRRLSPEERQALAAKRAALRNRNPLARL